MKKEINMKEAFENSFGLNAPDAKYIIGSPRQVFVIAKYDVCADDCYLLYVLEVQEKTNVCIKAGDYEELMEIVKLLTYSFSTVYFES